MKVLIAPDGKRLFVSTGRTGTVCVLDPVTGEGIETAAQEAELRTLGCDGGQGFLFARPLPAAEMEKLLNTSFGVLRDYIAA